MSKTGEFGHYFNDFHENTFEMVESFEKLGDEGITGYYTGKFGN